MFSVWGAPGKGSLSQQLKAGQSQCFLQGGTCCQAELNSHESHTDPLSQGPSEERIHFGFLPTQECDAFCFPPASCTAPFPALFAHPGRQGAHTAAMRFPSFPSSHTSSASRSKSVEVGATSQRQHPPLQALQGERTKERVEGSLQLPGSLKMPGSQLGRGKYTDWPLCLNDTLGHQLKPAVSAHPLPAMDTALEYPVLKQEG